MPTDRERREQLSKAADRIRARRDAQDQHGPREPTDPSLFRDSGLHSPSGDPRDPGPPGPRAGGRRGPVDVNVVGNQQVMRAMAAMAGHRRERGEVDESRGGPARINSPVATAQAAAQIAKEMRLAVDASERLAKLQSTHTETMARAHQEEREAVAELTRIVADTARAVREMPERESTGGGGSGGGGGTGRPMGPNDPHRPAGPSGGPFAWPGAFNPKTAHYDPGNLLGDGPIHGGPRNSYMDMMNHLAGGGDPNDFQPGQFMSAGRNYPASYGELKRNLRVRAGRALNNRFGEPTMPTLTPQYDDDGNITHHLYDRKDGSAPEEIHDSDQAQGIASTLVHGYAGAKMASRVAGGFARAGIGGALRAVPGIGIALAGAEAINEGAEWITEQRQANARYQGIQGGTNLEGVGERFRRFGNRMNERFTGGMTGEQADQLFDTLTNQGFRGDQRAGYIATASRNYKQLGMDPMQSAQLITEAANHANGGLINMAESIRTVTDTAIKYGISADTARGKLVQSMQQLEANGVMGGAGVAMAAGETAAVTSMGRDMQGVSFAGMNAELPTRIQAAQMGMGYGQFVGRRARDPLFGAQANDRFLNQQTQQYTTGANGQLMQRLIEEEGGKEAVANDPDKQRRVSERFQEEGNVDLSNAARQLAYAGITGVDANDPTSAGKVIVGSVVNDGKMLTKGTEKSIASVTQRDMTQQEKDAPSDSRSWWGKRWDMVKDSFFNAPGLGGDDTHDFWGNLVTPEMANKDAEKASGKVDPYIDSLIDPAKGVANGEHNGVRVKTKEGDKVVPLNTALKEYRDQIADGSAVIVGGDQDGKSVKDIMGGQVEQGYKGPKTADKDPTSDAQSEEDYRSDRDLGSKDGGGGDASGGTHVTVTAGPELQNWFKFNTGNGGKTEAGAGAGAPTNPGTGPTVGGGTPG